MARQEVGEFIATKVGVAAPDDAVDALHRRTDGNPLFVGEVIGSITPEQMAQTHTWLDGIPEAIREVIIRRLSRLSGPCEQVIRDASVIGRDFDLPLLQILCDELSEQEFLQAFDEAVAARVIESSPTSAQQFRFGHALIQQAVYEEFSPMHKMRMHAVIADALEQRHQTGLEAHAAELAHHFSEASMVLGNEKAITYSLIAGEQALKSFAYEQALIHFQRVLDAKNTQPMDDQMAEALFGLGRAQSTVLPRQELIQAHQNLTQAFEYYVQTSNIEQVVAIGEFPIIPLSEQAISTGLLAGRALELVPADSQDAARLHALYGRSEGLEKGDYPSAQRSFDQALAIAERDGNTTLEMATLLHAAQVDSWHHQFQLSLERSLRAAEIAVANSDLRSEVSARYWASIATRSLGDMDGYTTQALAILEPAERLRDRYWLAPAYVTAALCPLFEGDWESARRLNDLALAQMPMDPRVLLHRISLEAASGQREEMERYLQRLEEVAGNSAPVANVANASLALAGGIFAMENGPLARPKPVDDAIKAVLLSSAATPFFASWALTGASFIAAANNDADSARELYEKLKPAAGYLMVTVSVDRALGLLSQTVGDVDRAIGHFEQAEAFCLKGNIKPEVVSIRSALANALLQRNATGDRQRAGQLLESAKTMANEIEMVTMVDTVTALQARLGSRVTRSSDNPGGLTQREVEVLQLICGGMTDREIGEDLFISVKTVGNHVSNILNKTDSSNRTEAATYAAQHGIVAKETSE